MEMQQIREQFLAVKAEIETRLTKIHNYFHKRNAPARAGFHQHVLENYNDALVLKLEKEARADLRIVNNALKRLADGNYQACSRCGELISEAHLIANPYSELCLNCPERREQAMR